MQGVACWQLASSMPRSWTSKMDEANFAFFCPTLHGAAPSKPVEALHVTLVDQQLARPWAREFRPATSALSSRPPR